MPDKDQIKLYSYIKEMSIEKLNDEKQREESLIRQSSYMQTSISIGLACISLILGLSNRTSGVEFTWILKLAIINIFISLICAIFVQWRNKRAALNNICRIQNRILENKDTFLNEEVQLKDWIQHMDLIQESLSKRNTIRMYEIMFSIIAYILAILLIMIYLLCKF